MSTGYYLGVDGGQSSTTAMIGDADGRVLGFGQAGPCNHVKGPEGRPKFTNAINGCVGKACEQAGLEYASVTFEAACLGFSGGPADKEALLKEMLRCRQMVVTNDALIALTGATAAMPGIITIAGTGSIAYGRGRDGRVARAGGWGYVFGDEGGAFDITRQALRAALRYEEGWGPGTALHGRLMEETGAKNANDLLHQFYTTDWPRPRIATLAKVVDELAMGGDRAAMEILMSSAQQLAGIASAVRGQMFEPGEPAKVAYIGGVFRSGYLLERYRMLVELEDGNTVGPPRYGPAAGGLLEAYLAAGREVSLSNVPEAEK